MLGGASFPLLLAALFAVSPLAAQEKLDPAETEVLIDLVMDSPGYKEIYKDAGEAQRSAARIEVMDWIRQNPEAAGHLFSGFLIDERFPSSRFRDKFQEIVKERSAHFSSADSAVHALGEAAEESGRIQSNFHLSDDEMRNWTKQVFEKESDKGVLSGFTIKTPEGQRQYVTDTGYRLNAKVFRDIQKDGEARLRAFQAELEKDKGELKGGPLRAPGLQSSLEQRDDYIRKAREALAAFTGVLARRPEAVQSLKAEELDALNAARTETARQLALSALAAREYTARLQAAQLLSEPVDRAVGAAPLSDADKAAYRAALKGQAVELEGLAAAWADARGLLSTRAFDLDEARRRIAAAEKRTRALESRARFAHALPFDLYNEHSKNKLSWLARFWRWLVLTFLPKTGWAEAYRKSEAGEAVLASAFVRLGQGTL